MVLFPVRFLATIHAGLAGSNDEAVAWYVDAGRPHAALAAAALRWRTEPIADRAEAERLLAQLPALYDEALGRWGTARRSVAPRPLAGRALQRRGGGARLDRPLLRQRRGLDRAVRGGGRGRLEVGGALLGLDQLLGRQRGVLDRERPVLRHARRVARPAGDLDLLQAGLLVDASGRKRQVSSQPSSSTVTANRSWASSGSSLPACGRRARTSRSSLRRPQSGADGACRHPR